MKCFELLPLLTTFSFSEKYITIQNLEINLSVYYNMEIRN